MGGIGGMMLSACSNEEKVQEEHPNLLIVMADQFRGNALEFRGIENVQTPNLNRFSRRAVVLNQAVSGYPVSSPARGMFLSGAYPHENGVLTNCQSRSAHQHVELKKEMQCWSDVLASEGYATAYIGKWHLDKPYQPYVDCYNNKGETAWNEWCPPDRRHGFDYWVAYGTYDRHLRPLYWSRDAGRDDFYYVDQWGPEYEADLAIRYLDSIKHVDKPFALMVSMNPPHTGYELVPDRYKELYKTLNVDSVARSLPQLAGMEPRYVDYFKKSLPDYYACITGVDEQFGRIVDALKRNGLDKNTIVVFVSDHGDMMGTHNCIGKNIFYEEAMRIPFMIAYGEHWKPRMDDELLFSLEDFCPTILSLMGFQEKIPETVQTRDLSRQIVDGTQKSPGSQLYMLYSEVNKEGKHLTTGARGLRDKRYTYAVCYKEGNVTEEFLFDRSTDPGQLHNIVDAEKDIAGKMRQEMQHRLEAIGDPAASVCK